MNLPHRQRGHVPGGWTIVLLANAVLGVVWALVSLAWLWATGDLPSWLLFLGLLVVASVCYWAAAIFDRLPDWARPEQLFGD